MKSLRVTVLLFIITSTLFQVSCKQDISTKEDVLEYLKTLGNGKYMFGQVATWVHNENPDMDDPSNWLKKVYDHAGKMPRYGVITYDFIDDPFPDMIWNGGVKKMWDNGIIAGVFTFYANPSGGYFRDSVEVGRIFEPGTNPIKSNFYAQMDRMAANFQWLEDQGVPVIYTPFVELDGKWYPKDGRENAIKLYQLVHDYFSKTKGLDNILWAYHTMEKAYNPTTPKNVLEAFYPGDEYVDILGKSGYGSDLSFPEYEWAVEKKIQGKVIWWSELGINGKEDPPRDCFDVLDKLENSYPELAGFVFWSDAGHYNIIGNLNGPEFMTDPRIVTLE
ncbi:glycoside hydrolase family 26 protein [Bacteroidota bacterium]